MRDPFETPRHLPGETLLRLHDGECPPGEATAAQTHLETCWNCRYRYERVAEAAMRFVEYCDAAVESRGGTPDEQVRFRARLREQAGRPPSGATARRVLAGIAEVVLRPRPVAMTMAAVLLAAWLYPGRTVPAATASEVLGRASAAEHASLARVSRPVIRQRIEVRKGAERVEWEHWLAADRIVKRQWKQRSELAGELERVCRANGRDAGRLLSLGAHRAWREALGEKSEQVTTDEVEGVVRVETKTAGVAPGAIEAATLELRQTDLHPIAETLRLRSAEYQVRELSYAVIAMDEVAGLIEPAPVDKPIAAVSIAPAATPQPLAAAAASAEPWELEEAEATLRERLHRTGLERILSPEVRQESGAVVLRVFVNGAGQRRQVEQAVEDIRLVKAEIWDPETAPANFGAREAGAAASAGPLFRTTAPMIGKLAEQLGGAAQAAAFINEVHRLFRGILAESIALERLSARYPEPVFESLPAEARRKIEGIAASHHRVIEDQLPVLLRSLGEVWSVAGGSDSADCIPWRSVTLTLTARLRAMESSFNLLYVTREQLVPADTDPEQARQRASLLISELWRMARRGCRP